MAKKKKSRFGAKVIADVEKRQKEGSSYGYLNLPKGLSMFKEGEGRIKLDIIPYIVTDEKHPDFNPDTGAAEAGEPWYKRPIFVHRNIGVENESVVCPRTIGKKCPICEHRDKQFRDGVDRDAVIDKPQLRNLYLVIPVGHKEYDEEIHLWDISNYLFQDKLDDELKEAPEEGDFPDPEYGKTLNIRFSEETFHKNKYYEVSRIDFEERDESYDEDIMEEAPNLDEIFTVYSYKQLEAMFLEMDEEDIDNLEEEEEEEKPRKKKSFKKRKKEEEEDEESTDDDLPFNEDEEAPKKSRKADKQVEEEPEDDEPEEEEEKPKKKGKKSKTPKCPYKHKFGVDWDEYDDCDDCDLFDACGDANES